ncbi:lysophospholipid acyltransferase LPEAT1 isoform X2 [Tripterygium wilfordii]|uniref:Lysophospholipid acyltransferase LPEAT1 isoform X2 n=1 Tax=Tripterygium wilfordii TaxID=458696 RepID=A0A7J7DL86_TRIWF|nr:lysophospholipid acyltransferase LPEAT1-like isoform X2 [Tripterygium wilfordii]KAF5747097.1 lysophospholipid acyltransferase LPEAT1 isoform X2 [Tripterygium wilfordii]
MESEMEDLNSKPPEPRPPESAEHDGATAKDDRPLLKPEAVGVSIESLQDMEKKFAAYVRSDVYGPMGCGELPLVEKVLLAVACVTLVPIRVIVGMSLLVFYYFICWICTLFSSPNRDGEQEDYAHMEGWRRAVIVSCGRFLARVLLFVFGFYWIRETYGNPEASQDKPSSPNEEEGKDQSEHPERPGAIVSNHVSYLDILYHLSSSFPSFVAKRSVAKLPLVGLISKCLGCVYVQRESKSSDFKGVAGVVTERIREAHQNGSAPIMMLFPEGTTTNGDYILPFKTGAFLARAPVRPVILRYPYRRFSPAWDSISGPRHVIFLLCQFTNHMEVTWLPVYNPSQQEKDNPKLYADNVRRLMSREGNLIMSDIGLAEKRIYHAALNGLFSQY